jgi:hypothetical protein
LNGGTRIFFDDFLLKTDICFSFLLLSFSVVVLLGPPDPTPRPARCEKVHRVEDCDDEAEGSHSEASTVVVGVVEVADKLVLGLAHAPDVDGADAEAEKAARGDKVPQLKRGGRVYLIPLVISIFIRKEDISFVKKEGRLQIASC